MLEKRHISPALMELLLQEAAEKITDLGEQIVIRHLYIERRMVPLNIWLEQVEGQQLRDAIEEYGNAIRQLAAANIFLATCCLKTSVSPVTGVWFFMITMKFAT